MSPWQPLLGLLSWHPLLKSTHLTTCQSANQNSIASVGRQATGHFVIFSIECSPAAMQSFLITPYYSLTRGKKWGDYFKFKVWFMFYPCNYRVCNIYIIHICIYMGWNEHSVVIIIIKYSGRPLAHPQGINIVSLMISKYGQCFTYVIIILYA